MEVSQKHKVVYHEVTPSYRMKLSAAMRQLQEASVTHSDKVGCGAEDMEKEGLAWVLNKVVIDMAGYPRYDEEIELRTWHRKTRAFFAYRDYELHVGSEKLFSLTSLWLLLKKNEESGEKKIIKIPESITLKYEMEDKQATDLDIDSFKTDFKCPSIFSTEITVRSTDFDPIGHVNNSIYLDYLETLLNEFPENLPQIKRLVLSYLAEISPEVRKVRMDLGKEDSSYRFRVSSREKTFASGIFWLAEPGDSGCTP